MDCRVSSRSVKKAGEESPLVALTSTYSSLSTSVSSIASHPFLAPMAPPPPPTRSNLNLNDSDRFGGHIHGTGTSGTSGPRLSSNLDLTHSQASSTTTTTTRPTNSSAQPNNTNTTEDVNLDLRDGIDAGDPLTAKGRTKKRLRDKEAFDPDDPDRYRYRAYHIRRAFNLYGHIPTIINSGIKRRAKELAGENATNIQSDKDYESFQLIVSHLDGLNEDIVRLRRSPKAFRVLVRKIREAADQARNNDTANLKKDIASMLTADGSSVLTVMMKGKKASSKHDRGFANEIMGKYLCPISLDWNDELVREDIRNGKHAILASDWPRLLYADCHCDLDDLEKGLGRNMALVRTVKYLFTGRSAAFSEAAGGKTTRSGNAALAGMKEITPRVVAYGACMLRYAISTEESWSNMDQEFNMEEFYWNIVDIFDDSEDFGRDLLAWWNMKVFGTSFGTSLQVEPSPSTASNTLLKIQRAARRASRTSGLRDTTNILTVHQDNLDDSSGDADHFCSDAHDDSRQSHDDNAAAGLDDPPACSRDSINREPQVESEDEDQPVSMPASTDLSQSQRRDAYPDDRTLTPPSPEYQYTSDRTYKRNDRAQTAVPSVPSTSLYRPAQPYMWPVPHAYHHPHIPRPSFSGYAFSQPPASR